MEQRRTSYDYYTRRPVQRTPQRPVRRKRKQSAPIVWLWEFSKKVVSTAFLLYVIAAIYTLVGTYRAMLLIGDASALSTFISEMNETFRVVVGGYMLKAGGENVAKIVTTYMEKGRITKEEDEEVENY